MKLTDLTPNPDNPRHIRDEKFSKLVDSIRTFDKMMRLRPMVVDMDGVILGGNMRYRALQHLGMDDIPESWVIQADLTEEEKREFIIKDNVSFGEWDWETLANDWHEPIDDWGLDVPMITETERLSALEFEDVYYEPKEKPNLALADCLDLEKFNTKLKVIEDSPLTDEQKEAMRMFAYRFIKIDFESVANYYFFNASEDEQKVIERLRLVLCDSGLHGFIADDLLHVHELVQGWGDD